MSKFIHWRRSSKLEGSILEGVLCRLMGNVACLGSFASNPPSELDILWHDGHTLGVNSAQVGVFEQTDQVSFAGLLQFERHSRPKFSVFNKYELPEGHRWLRSGT